MKNEIETFKKFTAWSEAHAVEQLCKWLAKKGYDDDWECIANEMLTETPYSNHDDTGGWIEKGNGVSAHGSYNPEYKYRYRLEMHDVVQKGHKLEVTFYVSIMN
jgi:ribosomal protein S8